MIRVININKKTNQQHVPPDVTHEKEHNITYAIFLPKVYHLNLTTRKYWTKIN